jgi:hypothetical protein
MNPILGQQWLQERNVDEVDDYHYRPQQLHRSNQPRVRVDETIELSS